MKRVISLDVLRGLTIALMIVANLPGSWSAVLPMMRHAAWNGFTVADFIFPSFVFVMGVSMSSNPIGRYSAALYCCWAWGLG